MEKLETTHYLAAAGFFLGLIAAIALFHAVNRNYHPKAMKAALVILSIFMVLNLAAFVWFNIAGFSVAAN